MTKIKRPCVLEDQTVKLEFMASAMEAHGFVAIMADNIECALYSITNTEIDIISCDINLNPDDANDRFGVALSTLAAKMQPGIPIVVYSSHLFEDEISRDTKSIFATLLSKNMFHNNIDNNVEEIKKLALKHKKLRSLSNVRTSDIFSYDIFLRHNSKDKLAVRRLAIRLRKLGVVPWYDEWDSDSRKTLARGFGRNHRAHSVGRYYIW